MSSTAKAAVALAPPPTVVLDSPQPTQSTLRSITVTPFNSPLWGQGSANSYDYGYTTDPAATRPDDTLGSPTVSSSDPADPPFTSPVHVVLDLSDHDPTVNLYLMANANMTGVYGEWSTPVRIYGPGDTPPPSDDKQHGSVTGLNWSVSSQSKLWTLDVVASIQNVSCPATLVVTANGWTKRPEICGDGETAPSEVRFGWKVFNTDHSLPPNTDISVSAFVGRSKEPNKGGITTSLHVPKAPVLVGVGDSYSSGHHQDRDNPGCGAFDWLPGPPCHPDSLTENDPSFSWVTRLANRINAEVPAEWRYNTLILAQSGASTAQMETQGQFSALAQAVAARGQTWSIAGLTGGANDGDLAKTLGDFYRSHPLGNVKPWSVTNWSDCPDTQAFYNRIETNKGSLLSNLSAAISSARAASASIRFLDVLYPYNLKSDNVCNTDRQVPVSPGDLTHTQTWHGSKSVIDDIDEIHLQLPNSDVLHIDLRLVFGDNPLSDSQKTRYYGFPHLNGDGQDRVARQCIKALRV